MIYQFSQDITDMLVAKLFPVNVYYGPERLTRDGYYDSEIVIERDRTAADTIDTAHGNNPNPRRTRTRDLAAFATIYARSGLPGAHIGDHEYFCEQLIDALTVCFVSWATQGRSVVAVTDARYVDAKARGGVETWPGVVYVIKFRVSRGVYDRYYTGAGRLEGAAAHAAGTVVVTQDGKTPGEVVPVP